MPGGLSLNRVEDGTHLHNLPQQAPACSPASRPSRRAAGPIRRSRFGGIEGAKHRAAGYPQGFPLEASEARSAAGAKA